MLKYQIVESIRRFRDARAKRFSYDLGAICRDAPPPPKKEEDHGCLSSPPFPTPCHSDHSVLSDRSTFERSATKMTKKRIFSIKCGKKSRSASSRFKPTRQDAASTITPNY